MSPRYTTSEPAFKAHVSQWQRERASAPFAGTGDEFNHWSGWLWMAAIVIVPILLVAGWRS